MDSMVDRFNRKGWYIFFKNNEGVGVRNFDLLLGLRACSADDGLPLLSAGPLWGPGTVTDPVHDRMTQETAVSHTESDSEGELPDCVVIARFSSVCKELNLNRW